MAVLTVQHSSTAAAGLNPTYSASAPGGDSYVNTGAQTVLLRNQGTTPVTVTVGAYTANNQGTLIPFVTVVAAGATLLLGPFSIAFYNDGTGSVQLTYSSTVLAPPGAMAAALVASLGLGVGLYRYQVTIVNGSGETTGGTEISVTTTTGNQAVSLSGIPLGAGGTTQRRLWRTSVGGASTTEKLLAVLNDNTTTVYQDTLPDSALGAAIPTSNTAGVPPPGAASVATAAGTTLGVGVYKYQVTFTNSAGETTGGIEFTITTTTSNTNVAHTNVPLGPSGTTARKLYRTAVGGASTTEKLVPTGSTLNDNVTTSVTDSTADGSLGAAIPVTNTANVVQVAVTAP